MSAENRTYDAGASRSWELEALTRIDEVGTRCARGADDFDVCLGAILDAAIFLTAADKGDLQLLDPLSGCLVIRAQRGFEQPYVDSFAYVDEQSQTPSVEALAEARRVIVEDLTISDTWAAEVLRNVGVCAVQSTPLRSGAGRVVGVLSTHFMRSARLSERELSLMDVLARQAADYVERKQIETGGIPERGRDTGVAQQ